MVNGDESLPPERKALEEDKFPDELNRIFKAPETEGGNQSFIHSW